MMCPQELIERVSRGLNHIDIRILINNCDSASEDSV